MAENPPSGLSESEMNLLNLRMLDYYPLYDYKWYEVLPIFGMCFGKKKTETEDEALLQNNDDQMNQDELNNIKTRLTETINQFEMKNVRQGNEIKYKGTKIEWVKKEKSTDEEIFGEFGFGICSWFDLLRLLMKIYLVFSIFAMGLMSYYHRAGNNFEDSPLH